jgi:hypothetical protein
MAFWTALPVDVRATRVPFPDGSLPKAEALFADYRL